MSYKVEERGGLLYVKTTVGPGRKNDAATVITTQQVLHFLAENYPTYNIQETVKGGSATNGASNERRTNEWVFSYDGGQPAVIAAESTPPPSTPPPSISPPTDTTKKYRKVRKMRPKQK